MELLLDFALIGVGLLALIFGGDYTVRGAVQVAHKMAISPAVVGIGIIGFGTSLPELLVAMQAVHAGMPALALGNVVGSNIANILLVLGVGALIAPQICERPVVLRDGLFMVVVSLMLLPLLSNETLSRTTGFAMTVALILYLMVSYYFDKNNDMDTEHHDASSPIKSTVQLLGGMVVLMVGADVLVDSSVNVARYFAVPEAIIGLSLVAIGTSLPELAATVAAGLRKHTEIAIGNVLGSNIFNILGVLGVTGWILPFDFKGAFAMSDGYVAVGVAVLLVAILLLFGSLNRIMGALMLLGYGFYIYSIF